MPTYTDDFNRADGTLGSNWTQYANQIRVISNQAGCNADTATDHIAVYTGGAYGDDQYSQAKVTTRGTFPGVIVRLTDANNFYRVIYFDSTTLYLQKRVAGTFTLITSQSISAHVSGDVLRIEAQGTTLRVKVNGVTQITSTGQTDHTTGDAGMFLYDTTERLDDWEGGDLSAGAVDALLVIRRRQVFGVDEIVQI